MGTPTDRLDERDLEWLSLDDDETIVWSGGPDRRTLVPAFAIGIPLSLVLIGLFIIAGEVLRVRNTHYVITDSAVYRKTGILSRDVKRIDHEKIQDISYSQSALGSSFGYGTVELTTAGGSGVEMAFRSVTDPRAVQQRISEQRKRHREPSEDDAPSDVLEEILVELRAIRAAVEAAGADDADPEADDGLDSPADLRLDDALGTERTDDVTGMRGQQSTGPSADDRE
jgi:membrane protein YdbS with pleckstrin-like domain